MKNAKYDTFLLKIDELHNFKNVHFPSFLTEGEVEKVKKGEKCTLLKLCNSLILSKNMSYFAFLYVIFYEF